MSDLEERFARIESARRQFAELLWKNLPYDGSAIGNGELRKRTKTKTNDDYWKARDALVETGLARLGMGRGGSVARSADFVGELDSPALSGLEVSLYDGIVGRLKEMYRDESRFDELEVVATAHQGARRTGGTWTRPDLTLCGFTRLAILPGTVFEVHTFEVKTGSGFDVRSLHEAHSHRRGAHRSYVIVDLEEEGQRGRVSDLVPVARDLGVGLWSFVSLDGDWQVWHEPGLTQPDLVEVDRFLAAQLPQHVAQRVRDWTTRAAQPFGGLE